MAVVVDLYSRAVVGWSMQSNTRTEVVLDAMLMTKWRRQPQRSVMVHSDQGSQFGSVNLVVGVRKTTGLPV